MLSKVFSPYLYMSGMMIHMNHYGRIKSTWSINLNDSNSTLLDLVN